MHIDNASKSEPGHQSQVRFEQALSREQSRGGPGRSPSESMVQTMAPTTARRSVPEAQRVGVEFRMPQPGKVLKGAQESAKQVLSQSMMLMAAGFKTAFAKLGGAMDALKDGSLRAALGGAANKAGDVMAKSVEGMAEKTGQAVSRTVETATDRAGQMLSKTATVLAEGARNVIAFVPGRADGPAAMLDPGQSATLLSFAPGSGAEAQQATALAPATAAEAQGVTMEGILLFGPGLLAVNRRAKAAGSALKSVYMLGPNAQGADFVSITQDGKGFISGPDIDIALTDGGIDSSGYWSAGEGSGRLGQTQIALVQNENGCAFAFDGEDDVPQRITAWFETGETLQAEITATREM